MTISGLNMNVSPRMLANSPQLSSGTPLPPGTPLPTPGMPLQGGMLPSAAVGLDEKPGIGARLSNAMKAAVGALRGTPAPQAALLAEQLAMQSLPAQVVKKPTKKAAKPVVRAKNVKSAKSAKTLKNPPKQQTQQPMAPVAGQPVAGQPGAGQLPANATQLPGATVFSYDGNGNPAVAGLAGLDPQMQAQLGMSPTMLQGIHGLTQQVDPAGPQMNATNQNNLGAGMGMGMGMGMGSAVPVLGAPILLPPATPAANGPGDSPAAGAGTGGTQAVSNVNSSDTSSLNQGNGYGYGSPFDPSGGIATPYSPYGSSMSGVNHLGSRGFLSRLFGR